MRDINYMRELWRRGELSSAEMDEAEATDHRENYLANLVMPRPNFDMPRMELNTMRHENGPEAGRVARLSPQEVAESMSESRARGEVTPAGYEPMRAVLMRSGLNNDKAAFEHYIRAGELPAPKAAPAAPAPEKLGDAVISTDGRKGRWSQDSRYIVYPDGSRKDLDPSRAALEAKARWDQMKAEQAYRKGETDITHSQEQIATARAARAPAIPGAGIPQAALEKQYGKAPDGSRWRADGTLESIGGGDAPMKLTESQGRALTFGQRAANSHEILGSVGQDGKIQPHLGKRAAEALPDWLGGAAAGMAMNKYASPAQQQVEQAERDFINAVLRRESGAVISPSEFDNARRQYFPQPNDSPEVIKQKRRNRELVVSSFADEAGPAKGKVVQVWEGAKLKGAERSKAIFDARKALQEGRSRSAVMQRLQQMGISPAEVDG